MRMKVDAIKAQYSKSVKRDESIDRTKTINLSFVLFRFPSLSVFPSIFLPITLSLTLISRSLQAVIIDEDIEERSITYNAFGNVKSCRVSTPISSSVASFFRVHFLFSFSSWV